MGPWVENTLHGYVGAPGSNTRLLTRRSFEPMVRRFSRWLTGVWSRLNQWSSCPLIRSVGKPGRETGRRQDLGRYSFRHFEFVTEMEN